jgi:serine/threonine protein kinase
MHSRNVFHRDIKTDNILIDDESHLKFIDFGISKLHKGETVHTKNVVTRCYRAPEVLFGSRDYDLKAVDMWSVGCVFAELMTGSILFPGHSDIE